jgi:hypothetical protein
MDPLITTALISGIIAVFALMFKSIKKSECWKTDTGVCCDFDTRRSSSSIDTVIENTPPKRVIQSIIATEV